MSADVSAIQRVVALYSHVIDDRAWSDLDQVYADDAVLDLSAVGAGEHRGPAAIGAFLQSQPRMAAALLTTNVVIDVTEGENTGSGRARFLSIRTDGTLAAGTYLDDYVRTQHGWRIARRAARRLVESG
jgi:hypothetical protein